LNTYARVSGNPDFVDRQEPFEVRNRSAREDLCGAEIESFQHRMPLPSGHRLGPYEIIEPLGAGGMGEVYKGRDTRLGRLVAIKIAGAQFSSRFESEARAISALNHPNICTLHDVGPNYLVMELMDGETLAAILRKGALPMDRVLVYGAQIADAIAAAHSQGITHRDLKPGNIMVVKSGVKVLDFGLAKMPLADDTVTASNMALGTPAYMAPEQREGKPCDARTDIFALGLVLYEMATGKRYSAGQDRPAIDGLPLQFAHVVERCLEPEPESRWQSARDVQAEIEWAARGPSSQILQAKSRGPWIWAGAAVASAVLLTLSAYLFGSWRSTSSIAGRSQPVTRFAMDLAPTEQFPMDQALPAFLGVAPDGRVFYAARRDGTLQLYVRGLGEIEAAAVPGTEGAMMPFFSPDGNWLGFASKGELRKAPISGGPTETLAAALSPTGASWGLDGTIVFAPSWSSGLFKISAGGGSPEQLTILNSSEGETSHRDPQILPDGRGVLFTAVGKHGPHIEIVSESGTRRVLTEGSNPVYLRTGYLVMHRAQTLLAAPLDLRTLELRGPPVPILDGVQPRSFALGPDGTLVYVPAASNTRKLVWVDRQGNARPLAGDRRAFNHPRLSPDGKRIAVETGDGSIWLYDTSAGARTRLTEKPTASRPIWTPDGKRVTFAGWTDGRATLYSVPVDGSAEPKRILDDSGAVEEAEFPLHWSHDGGILAFSKSRPGTLRNIWMLPAGGAPQPWLDTPADERPAMFSPDGRWLVYAVRQANREEDVYVQPYPGPGPKFLISTGGGAEPVWSPTGREIFYRSLDGTRMMTVNVQTNPSFKAAAPKLLFQGKYYFHPGGFYPTYDVTRDAQQFVMIQPEQQAVANRLIVTVNWVEELRRRVPEKTGEARP
jgi:Tol biopolymer transport system component